MRNDTAVLAAPALPQVNLLPGDVRQARTLGAVKRWLLVSGGVTAVAIGTVAGVAHLQGQSAASELAQAEAEFASLQVQQGPFVQVTQVHADLETMRSARAFGLTHEILWSDYLGSLTAVTPAGVGIVSLEYRGATPLSAAPASADPLVPAALGTLSFNALAAELPDTAAWADALERVPGFRDVRVTGTTRADKGGQFRYEISGTIQVDDRALAHRFAARSEGDS